VALFRALVDGMKPSFFSHGTVAELHRMFGDVLSLQDRVNPQMQRYRRFLGDERVYGEEVGFLVCLG
jgi:hypothetical protein